MKGFFFLLLMLVPMQGQAEVAQDVAELHAKVEAAEGKLAEIQARIEKARVKHGKADAELRQAVKGMVAVGQYPEGFWLARSVVMDTPGQADLLRAMATLRGREIVQAQAKVGQLSALYGDANRQVQALRDVEEAYGDAHGKLLAAEKAVLRRAGVQADALSEDLQAALDSSGTVAVVPIAPAGKVADGGHGGLPVAGRVDKSFGQSAGAAKAGVVLKAKAGGVVQATQAAKVLYAGPFRNFGGLVIVKTVRGEDVLLGGLGTLSVRVGDDVAAGQVLGTAGDTGRIYWEVRRNGRPVNPL